MPSVTVYGIKTCETVRKARAWLAAHDVEYRFHDYRVDGLDKPRLEGWCDALGWERLLNRSSATFRELSGEEKPGLDRQKAMRLMLAHPTMIKRPVSEIGTVLLVGFKPDAYEAALTAKR